MKRWHYPKRSLAERWHIIISYLMIGYEAEGRFKMALKAIAWVECSFAWLGFFMRGWLMHLALFESSVINVWLTYCMWKENDTFMWWVFVLCTLVCKWINSILVICFECLRLTSSPVLWRADRFDLNGSFSNLHFCLCFNLTCTCDRGLMWRLSVKTHEEAWLTEIYLFLLLFKMLNL